MGTWHGTTWLPHRTGLTMGFAPRALPRQLGACRGLAPTLAGIPWGLSSGLRAVSWPCPGLVSGHFGGDMAIAPRTMVSAP